MSEKSFVTMVQHVCLSCGKTHDTGELAMRATRDGRIRLEPTMDRYTVMGASPCPECAPKIAAGYIALVECDPAKTKRETDADGVDRCNPRDVSATGRALWMKAESFARVFKAEVPTQAIAYIEPEVYEMLKAMNDRAESGAAVQ
jgi:hypothetical protein